MSLHGQTIPKFISWKDISDVCPKCWGELKWSSDYYAYCKACDVAWIITHEERDMDIPF